MIIGKHRRSQILPLVIILLGISALILINLVVVDIIEANDPIKSEVKKSFEVLPFIWTVGIVGGCIALTLAYVSWQKYRAEKKKQLKKKSNG